MTYQIIQKKKLWLSISGVLMAISVIILATWGLRPGIDFTGGSLLELRLQGERLSSAEVSDAVKSLDLGSLSVQPADNSVILRFQQTDEETHQNVLAAVSAAASLKNPDIATDQLLDELTFTAIGPSIGQEMKRKALTAIILVLIAISLYISYAFRKVSKPVESWKYGMATLVALVHDVTLVVGFYAVLGHFWGVEVNTSFITAALTVLGFSVHDTIVVFDRIRENLPKSSTNFEETVNHSVNQTITRSINTSMTVMLTLLAVTIFGGPSIMYFSLALLVGIFFGTYSSIFLASPVLVLWNSFKK